MGCFYREFCFFCGVLYDGLFGGFFFDGEFCMLGFVVFEGLCIGVVGICCCGLGGCGWFDGGWGFGGGEFFWG